MTMRYPHDHEKDVIYFGVTNFRNQMRKFGIKTDDRRRHMYVIGKTGMGKSVLLENMILSDIYAGHGCCYVDPHGDTAEKLIDHIPSWRINDVVYWNPADADFPIAFNVLEKSEGWEQITDYNSKVMGSLLSIFKKVWENVWSARMEYILQNTILALLDTPGTTLLGVNRMLSDKEYRTSIIASVKDPVVQQFWLKEFAAYDTKFAAEAVAPIQNKIGQLLTSTIMRNIVAQAKSTIKFREIMDEQKILIVNLSKGRIGEDAMRILGGMLVTKLYMSAMERVNVPESERQDFYLYVDEFQNFAVESFANILSEARKYRLNLIMAHQYISQLDQKDSTAVRDAVFGNVGSMVTFRVGSPDAEFLESEFMPRFTPEDLINLPKYSVYLKLMIDGVTSQPFSAGTLPPIAQRTLSAEKVIEQTRERYGGSRKKIEEHILEWSGYDPNVNVAEEFAKVAAIKKDEKKKRFSHEYVCSRCSKTFAIPVELDRSRPIYCEECKVIITAEREAAKKGGPKHYPAPKAPTLQAGEAVVRPSEGTVSLSALQAPVERREIHVSDVHVAPVAPAVSSQAPAPAAPASTPATTQLPRAPQGEQSGERKKRKRRRRNKKDGDRGQGETFAQQSSAPQGAAAATRAGTVPTPVVPGERITFDE
ncbi:MAG: hypothetical protein UY72_C0028G0007 [Candidatus Uhrbacteria bacterium GW2011_GWD2_52_7]|uniref:Type IV secretion system coupling protein TraD DNA-binding domain-containing protein n=1 Tax=Candidatus Uhrbacteria bacterium GW2011_GWD2_52_7 TaxID=1618989 RepID=A0A0G2AC15_9BACT|nr:MAG: hypothetical protein UY72_C0028G0007 [Candidatus Uhrbacteria bacterium GW2011_GWD2_52_7]